MTPVFDAGEFDYVIVGAGSAGCVLAHRLSRDPHVRVLLLEAGGPARHPLIRIPLGAGVIYERRMFSWGYRSEPEPQLEGRSIDAMRGKLIGGSSSVNMMAHTRGHPADFDRWAQGGATGWSYAEVLPYFKRSESWEGGENAYRGVSGPTKVQATRFQDSLSEGWIAAGQSLGYGFNEDYNAALQEGFGRAQFATGRGWRSSAAAAYLHPVMHRANLTVWSRSHACRVMLQGRRAVGVELLRGGRRHAVRATREVLVCAGVFDSPKLLMLSGIGPAAHLREFGIAVHSDLPVGANLQDHPAVQIMWSRKGRGPFAELTRVDRMAVAMLRAWMWGTGPATMLPSPLHAFVRTRADSRVPDIEFMFRAAPLKAHLWFPLWRKQYADAYGIRPTLLHPRSRGDVRLRSANAQDPVRIRFNMFSEHDDLARLCEGVRLGRALGEATAMDTFRGVEMAPGAQLRDDAQIEQWVRKTAITANHAAGTCPMGQGESSVLDPQLRVRGVDALRVVDAAAMPDLVSAHINAAVLMLAERAADLISGVPLPGADG